MTNQDEAVESADANPQQAGQTSLETKTNEPKPDFINWFEKNSIPLAGFILGALILCLIGHYSSITVDWTKTKDFTDAFRNVTQGLAFIAGGFWAYFKFVKGRTFQESLSPVVTGRFASIDGGVFLVVTTQIKNVGLSQITFNQKGSVLIVFEYAPGGGSQIITVADRRLTSFAALDENDRYIEPGETIEMQRLISIPGSLKVAYRLELEIVSTNGYIWHATTIVDKSTVGDNKVAELIGV